MTGGAKRISALYVDRDSRKWVALDAEGNFWAVSSDDDNPWDRRQPFRPTEETDLKLVPGHYKHMLGLPT